MKQESLEMYDRVIDELATRNLYVVSAATGINHVTLYNWVNGITIWPRIGNVLKVADFLGFNIKITKARGKLKRVA